MKVFSYRLAVGFFLASFATACSGDGTGLDDNGQPVGEPDNGGTATTGPTLSGQVQPIFTTNCAFSGCHGGTSPRQNMNLGAGLAFANLIDVAALEAPLLARIRPGQPDSSYLIFKITGTQATVGGSGGRMPLGGNSLSAADVSTITQWVENGAPDN